MDKNYSFIVVNKHYVLQYIIAPNKIVYFNMINKDKLICSSSNRFCLCFVNRDDALIMQEKIKNIFDLEFQIVEV